MSANLSELMALVAEGELEDLNERWAFEMMGWSDEEEASDGQGHHYEQAA